MSRETPSVSHAPWGLSNEDARGESSDTEDHGEGLTCPVYRGYRTPTAPIGEECTVTVDGEPLERRYDLLSASPTGFEWGYGGSGPAQLAVALLAHAYDDEFAAEHYQRFKGEVVAELPRLGWMLTGRDLDEWRESIE